MELFVRLERVNKKPYIVIISHFASKCNAITHKTPKKLFLQRNSLTPAGGYAPGGDALGGASELGGLDVISSRDEVYECRLLGRFRYFQCRRFHQR